MRTFLLRFVLITVIITVISAGSQAAANAQDLAITPDAAFDLALADYNASQGQNYAITEMRHEAGLAYAIAGPGIDQAEESYAVFLAENLGAVGWRTLVPGRDSPAEYNLLLDRFPESLLDEALKAMFHQVETTSPESPEMLLMAANFTGHRLPWAYKTTAYVTQKDNLANNHMNQIDFDIRGLAASGDVYASRPGRVVFVKDSSNTTCQDPSTSCMRKPNVIVIEHASGEYSWYLHLAYRSAAVTTGQQVGYGTKIGVEGETGFSFGIHLHYMASTGHTAWTDPNNPDASPWATGITAVDFDEYSWAALEETYTSVYTSQNGANLPPVCPAAGGALLYREASYNCAGLLENSGYTFRNEPAFQNLNAFSELASSARVPQGWSMMLYEHGDGVGGKKCLNVSDDNFADDTFDNGHPLDNQVSSIEVFNAPNCPLRPTVDLTAPDGGLSSPTSGSTVGRSIELISNASDGQSGVQMVRFTAKWGSQEQVIYTDTSAPFSYKWDLCAAGVPDGSLELGHIVVDNAWNSVTALPIPVIKAYDCSVVPQGTWSVDYWANPNLTGPPVLHTQQASPFLFNGWGNSSPDASLIPADGWSARYVRTFAFSGGNYHFYCQSAGGCRVLIDGQLRINEWQEADFAGDSLEFTLSAGEHTVFVEFFDASGEARLETWWQGPDFLPPESGCAPNQWCAEVWGNDNLRGSPAVWRDEGETLRRSWGLAGPYPLLPGDNISARYKRQEFFECGTYRFSVVMDGPTRLWVDGGTPIIDKWAETGSIASYSAEITLARGIHDLVVEHADQIGTGGLEVSWERRSSCAASAVFDSVSTHIARPNARFDPRLQVRMTGGYLSPARGDGLAFVSGNSFSAGPGLVRQPVETNQSYIFDASNGFQMTAPATSGTHIGQWQVRAGGSQASTTTNIQVVVDGSAPQVSLSSPSGSLNSSNIPVRANVSDNHSGVSHVQFIAGANFGGGWAWQVLGWDSNGADGWGIDWNPGSIADQNGIVFLAAAWDKAGNYSEARSASMTLDRTSPTVAISGPATIQDTTRLLVQWSGSDAFSGLHHFDVQVRVDGGAAQNWLMNVSPSTYSAWYTGEMGHSYAFQVRAVDKAGNASAYTSPTADAVVRICAPDAYEPDNTSAQAGSMQTGLASTNHSLCGTGDLDWYVFQAQAGQIYRVLTRDLGQTTDTVLTLFAANGLTKLAESDLPNNPSSVLLWKAQTDGPLYFSVRHADSRAAGSAVTYTVRVNPVVLVFLPSIFR